MPSLFHHMSTFLLISPAHSYHREELSRAKTFRERSVNQWKRTEVFVLQIGQRVARLACLQWITLSNIYTMYHHFTSIMVQKISDIIFTSFSIWITFSHVGVCEKYGNRESCHTECIQCGCCDAHTEEMGRVCNLAGKRDNSCQFWEMESRKSYRSFIARSSDDSVWNPELHRLKNIATLATGKEERIDSPETNLPASWKLRTTLEEWMIFSGLRK